MSTLTTFRDHCRKMARAEHKPECPTLHPWRPRWDWVATRRGESHEHFPDGEYDWRPEPPKPKCAGCNTKADQALFAQLADEVDRYEQLDLATEVTSA